jgi:hypothetical protein
MNQEKGCLRAENLPERGLFNDNYEIVVADQVVASMKYSSFELYNRSTRFRGRSSETSGQTDNAQSPAQVWK